MKTLILVLMVLLGLAACLGITGPMRACQRDVNRRNRGQTKRRENSLERFGALFVGGCVWALTLPARAWRRVELGPPLVFANIGEGAHGSGQLPYYADAAQSLRFALVKQGTNARHVAVAGAADLPIGVCTDEASAAEDLVNVTALGAAKGTVKMVASAAITVNSQVYTAASGKVQGEPSGAGTYYMVGISRTASAADLDVIEVQPIPPLKVVVVSAHGSVDGAVAALTISASYSQAEVQALRAAVETLGDDFRALAGALATPAIVKVI